MGFHACMGRGRFVDHGRKLVEKRRTHRHDEQSRGCTICSWRFGGCRACECLAIRRNLFGDENVDVAVTINNLAALLRDQGDYAGAEPLFREALAIMERNIPPGHSRTANSRAGLATEREPEGTRRSSKKLRCETGTLDNRVSYSLTSATNTDLSGVRTSRSYPRLSPDTRSGWRIQSACSACHQG